MSMDGHGNPHNLTPHGNIPDFRAIVHLPPLAVLPRPTLHGLWLCAIRPNDRRCSAQPPCTPATPAATGLVLVSVRNRPFPPHPAHLPPLAALPTLHLVHLQLRRWPLVVRYTPKRQKMLCPASLHPCSPCCPCCPCCHWSSARFRAKSSFSVPSPHLPPLTALPALPPEHLPRPLLGSRPGAFHRYVQRCIARCSSSCNESATTCILQQSFLSLFLLFLLFFSSPNLEQIKPTLTT